MTMTTTTTRPEEAPTGDGLDLTRAKALAERRLAVVVVAHVLALLVAGALAVYLRRATAASPAGPIMEGLADLTRRFGLGLVGAQALLVGIGVGIAVASPWVKLAALAALLGALEGQMRVLLGSDQGVGSLTVMVVWVLIGLHGLRLIGCRIERDFEAMATAPQPSWRDDWPALVCLGVGVGTLIVVFVLRALASPYVAVVTVILCLFGMMCASSLLDNLVWCSHRPEESQAGLPARRRGYTIEEMLVATAGVGLVLAALRASWQARLTAGLGPWLAAAGVVACWAGLDAQEHRRRTAVVMGAVACFASLCCGVPEAAPAATEVEILSWALLIVGIPSLILATLHVARRAGWHLVRERRGEPCGGVRDLRD
jgi:hypothetical protein